MSDNARLDSETLHHYEHLQYLNDEQLARVAQRVKVQTVSKGTLLFKRGKALTEYFYLQEGEVDLINNEFGVEKIISGTDQGRLVLNRHTPSKVSAVAKTPVVFFTLERSVLTDIAGGFQSAAPSPVIAGSTDAEPAAATATAASPSSMVVGDLSGDDWMTCLLQSPVFARIPWAQLQELFARFETVSVKRDQRIVKEGARGDYFYVVAAGSACVTTRSGNAEVILRPGQYFGEEALISRSPRNASVTMLSDGLLKRLSEENFGELVQRPVIQYWSAETLASLSAPSQLLDVRMPMEFRIDGLEGSRNIPLARLRDSLDKLDKSRVYAISGQAGARAEIAAYLLCQAGFDAVILENSTTVGIPENS